MLPVSKTTQTSDSSSAWQTVAFANPLCMKEVPLLRLSFAAAVCKSAAASNLPSNMPVLDRNCNVVMSLGV